MSYRRHHICLWILYARNPKLVKGGRFRLLLHRRVGVRQASRRHEEPELLFTDLPVHIGVYGVGHGAHIDFLVSQQGENGLFKFLQTWEVLNPVLAIKVQFYGFVLEIQRYFLHPKSPFP